MKLGTVPDVGNDEHGGVTVLKEYKGQLLFGGGLVLGRGFPEKQNYSIMISHQ